MKLTSYLLLMCCLIGYNNTIKAQTQPIPKSVQKDFERTKKERYEQQLVQLKNNYDLQNMFADKAYQDEVNNINSQNLTPSARRKLIDYAKDRYNNQKKVNKDNYERQKSALKNG